MPRVKHGMSYSKTYKAWQSMKERCSNPKNSAWIHYGARGISYCPEWESFENFYYDMGDRPHGLELDRIDNNAGYSKENCRWTTPSENKRNRRLMPSNKTGMAGIRFNTVGGIVYIRAIAYKDYKETNLYHGKDFFLACCARKSWENSLAENSNV